MIRSRRCIYKIGIILLTCILVGLVLHVRIGSASTQGQTVPTMPPPTATRSITPFNTPTNPPHTTVIPQPSATAAQATYIPPIVTEGVLTSEIVIVASSTYQPASPMTPSNTVPSLTSYPISTTGLNNPPFTTATFISNPTAVQILPGSEGKNMIAVDLIGGGAVLVIITMLGIWLSHKYKQVRD